MDIKKIAASGPTDERENEKLQAHHSQVPLDFGDSDECILLAALVGSAMARAEFVRLGIGPRIFAVHEIRTVAAAVLADPDKWMHNLTACDALTHKSEGRILEDALETRFQMLTTSEGMIDEAWAVHEVRRRCKILAARWMPEHLRWAADQLERGVPLPVVDEHLLGWIALGHSEAAA